SVVTKLCGIKLEAQQIADLDEELAIRRSARQIGQCVLRCCSRLIVHVLPRVRVAQIERRSRMWKVLKEQRCIEMFSIRAPDQPNIREYRLVVKERTEEIIAVKLVVDFRTK